jgi:hypothetical protein
MKAGLLTTLPERIGEANSKGRWRKQTIYPELQPKTGYNKVWSPTS